MVHAFSQVVFRTLNFFPVSGHVLGEVSDVTLSEKIGLSVCNCQSEISNV